MKLNEDGVRLCDSKDCEMIATHWLVWTEPRCYCAPCAQQIIGVGRVMGFSTPAATVRPMTSDEMMPEESDS